MDRVSRQISLSAYIYPLKLEFWELDVSPAFCANHIIWKRKKPLVLIITPILKGNRSLQTSNEINASLQKLLRENNIFTLYFTPTTKTKSKKGHNDQNFMDDYQHWTWLVFYNDTAFCKLSIKSMHPYKNWVETNINTQQKVSRKRAIY